MQKAQIEVLGPSINNSQQDYSIENNKIRLGLSAVKNVGTAAISTILTAREKEEFKSFEDFCNKVDLSKVNKKTFESLIKAGAFDGFGKRSILLSTFGQTVSQITKKPVKKLTNQISLFGEMTSNIPMQTLEHDMEMEEFTDGEKLMFERELLGFFLSDHPLNHKINTLFTFTTHKIADLAELKDGTKIKVGGLIANIKKIFTKKNNSEMAFVRLEDHLGSSVECVVFPKVYERSKAYLTKDAIVIMDGRLDFKEDLPVLIVESIRILN